MKNRLQRLWDETVPLKGPAPQPDPDAVLRLVNAELDGRSRPVRRRRPLKYAAILAAAVLLFAGTAIASGQGILPEVNVLDSFFRGDDSEYARSLVNTDEYSVSDDNYTMTVTSNFADDSTAYFTLLIKPKNDKARQFLSGEDIQAWKDLFGQDEEYFSRLLQIKTAWIGGDSGGMSSGFDPELDALEVSVSRHMGIGLNQVSVRFDVMEEGIWLKFPVKHISSVKLKIDAEGQGMGSQMCAAGGPVTLEKVVLSPASIKMKYTTLRYENGDPLVYFLWKDGSLSTYGQLGIRGPSGNGSQKGEEFFEYNYSWKFAHVQDIRQMEAIVFENMAYPLDGGEPYAYDTSGQVRPFAVQSGEQLNEQSNASMPLFAVCEGLGIPYEWDEEAGRLSMTFRDVTMTFTAGSDVLILEGAEQQEDELRAAPVFEDGELWADAYGPLIIYWSVAANHADKNKWAELDGLGPDGGGWGYWLIIP